MGEKLPRILPKVATSTSILGSFTCRKFTTWDRRLYFPSGGRRAEDFFARKIRRLWPGLNTRTWVPEASTFTSRPPKPLLFYYVEKSRCWLSYLGCCYVLYLTKMNTTLLSSGLLHITNVFAKCFIYPTTKHTELQRRKVKKITCALRMEVLG